MFFKDDQTCSTWAERLKVMASTIEDDRELFQFTA